MLARPPRQHRLALLQEAPRLRKSMAVDTKVIAGWEVYLEGTGTTPILLQRNSHRTLLHNLCTALYQSGLEEADHKVVET